MSRLNFYRVSASKELVFHDRRFGVQYATRAATLQQYRTYREFA